MAELVEVSLFAMRMEAKLRANDHKGHWRDCSIEYLRTRLHEELGELLTVLDKYETVRGTPTAELVEQIADESADVANFCMMIADVCRARAK
jgi:NTP pyrophosphatase (non-canonical NTP hydrolase)